MRARSVDIDIAPEFYIAAAAVFLLFPIKLVLAWAIAVTVHELGHILLLKGEILGIYIMPSGVLLQTKPIPIAKEVKAAIMGPAASFALCLLFRTVPIISFFAFIQFMFNILPIYPLDGGRILFCILKYFCGIDKAQLAMRCIFVIIFMTLFSLSIYFIFAYKLVLPAIISFILFFRQAKGKIPCKCSIRGVQ